MAKYKWPETGDRKFIGKRISRIDGPAKVQGKARYTYDTKEPGMLFGKILRSPHAHARIVSIDSAKAEKMAGVVAVKIIQGVGTEIQWAGDEILAVAAVDETTAEDAVRAIHIEYEILPHYVWDRDSKDAGERAKPMADQVTGTPDEAFAQSEAVMEGEYGIPVIAHSCLESHGTVCSWNNEELMVRISTQNVSGIPEQMAGPLGIKAGSIRVKQDHIGGGFGSKFAPDRWGIENALLSKLAGGKPIKMMLDRQAEMTVAGSRPSFFARVKVGVKKDGTILAWESESCGTGGISGGGMPPVPYVFEIPNQRKKHTAISTNTASARAWRAPNHPQACLVTMAALEDAAAKLNMDPVDFFLKNIQLTGTRADYYREELQIGSDLIEWKKNWHPRGESGSGIMKRGLGLSLHTWGGRGHDSKCDLTIHPDGSVEAKLGSQDLGTGTRTVINQVVADSLGLPMEQVRVLIGDSGYPVSGGSGGSTTIGGVSSSSRRASVNALEQLYLKVAPALNAQPAELECVDGKIRVIADPSRSLSWGEACRKLGAMPLTARGENPGPGNLSNSGVGGIQMADVSVDVETGVVRLNKMVAVQDCGLVINPKLAESQCYGAMIMGICYSLYEEKIMDRLTGVMLNPNLEFYKLAGIGDFGELVVHMMITPTHDARGVIGLGEPPVISPGAAISNAVANAIGVRVPHLPLTPDRVLEALQRKGGNHASL